MVLIVPSNNQYSNINDRGALLLTVRSFNLSQFDSDFRYDLLMSNMNTVDWTILFYLSIVYYITFRYGEGSCTVKNFYRNLRF